MTQITFDITYRKKTDTDALKMQLESEFNQLKLIICGKYKIYDISTCFLYSNNELLIFPEKTKLKDIFKKKRVKITLQTEKIVQPKPQISTKYFCKCKTNARFICDKCDEFLCEICSKKSKHNIHITKIIKIEEYNNYIKNYLHESAKELDEKIIKDEAYKYFCYWNYDLSNEISGINQCYEYAKQQLEDIKQIQIDTLITLSNTSKFSNFSTDLESLILSYSSIDTQENLINMLADKSKLLNDSNDMINKFSELKQAVLIYNDTIKDIQVFNQGILKEIKERFLYIKRKYVGSGGTYNPNSTQNSILVNQQSSLRPYNLNTSLHGNLNNVTMGNVNLNLSLNNTYTCLPHLNHSMNKYNQTSYRQSDTNQLNTTLIHEKLLLKLKNNRKILAFLTRSQTFKEKVFIDNANFKTNMTSETDITQLNHMNKLYMLTGKNYNKVFYYEYVTNSVFYLSTTLFSHYYGALIFCPSNNSLYLIGGNNTTKCETYQFNLNNSQENFIQINEWKEVPELNEERQEFASLCMNDYIYVFFGFSSRKGYNLSSIERLNIEKTDRHFEVIYVNEQIRLSSIACARYMEKEVIILGGFDGENYLDSSLIFNPTDYKVRDCHIVIPNMTKHFQFLFQKESQFVYCDSNQALFDMKNNAHMITKDSYEVFTELKK